MFFDYTASCRWKWEKPLGKQGMIPNGFSLFCIANAPISLGIKVSELLCCRFAKSLSY